MPATEKTWRDIKKLHVTFAVSGVILLIATLWMFAADHGREWKNTQRVGLNIENTVTRLSGTGLPDEDRQAIAAYMATFLDAPDKSPDSL